jgi:hypothetical protein
VKETYIFEDLGITLEDNIKMDLKEIGTRVVNWIHLVQDRD